MRQARPWAVDAIVRLGKRDSRTSLSTLTRSSGVAAEGGMTPVVAAAACATVFP
jgi:hypothetical protein